MGSPQNRYDWSESLERVSQKEAAAFRDFATKVRAEISKPYHSNRQLIFFYTDHRNEAAEGQLQTAIKDFKHAQSVVPLVEYAAALEDLYRSAGMVKESHEQEKLIETIEKLGRATGEKTNRNLALALADHNKNPDLALHLVQAEIPVRSDVYTWDALSWVLFKPVALAKQETRHLRH